MCLAGPDLVYRLIPSAVFFRSFRDLWLKNDRGFLIFRVNIENQECLAAKLSKGPVAVYKHLPQLPLACPGQPFFTPAKRCDKTLPLAILGRIFAIIFVLLQQLCIVELQ